MDDVNRATTPASTDIRAILEGNNALLFLAAPCFALVLDNVVWQPYVTFAYWLFPISALVHARLDPRQLAGKGQEALLFGMWLLAMSTLARIAQCLWPSAMPLYLATTLLERVLVFSAMYLTRQFIGRIIH